MQFRGIFIRSQEPDIAAPDNYKTPKGQAVSCIRECPYKRRLQNTSCYIVIVTEIVGSGIANLRGGIGADEIVVAGPAEQFIGAGSAVEIIVVGFAFDVIGSTATQEVIVSIAAEESVGVGIAEKRVVTRIATDCVSPVVAVEKIVADTPA